MRAPEMMGIVLAGVRVVYVRKPRLAAFTIILEDGEEARHAVPRSPVTAHPPAYRLRAVIPIVMLVKELSCGIPHELRGADVVLVRIDHAPHESLRAR